MTLCSSCKKRKKKKDESKSIEQVFCSTWALLRTNITWRLYSDARAIQIWDRRSDRRNISCYFAYIWGSEKVLRPLLVSQFACIAGRWLFETNRFKLMKAKSKLNINSIIASKNIEIGMHIKRISWENPYYILALFSAIIRRLIFAKRTVDVCAILFMSKEIVCTSTEFE